MNRETLSEAAQEHGTPLYVYDREDLRTRARTLTSLTFPFGSTIRYAAKANSAPEIIALFHEEGLHFDASSSYEAEELIARGIPPTHISLSSQQPAHNLEKLLTAGVHYVVTSLHQFELFLKTPHHPGSVALRVNAGLGAGGTNRTTTGGTASSFGLCSSSARVAEWRMRSICSLIEESFSI